MKIGVDASCWANERGYGRFTRELCRALFTRAGHDQFTLFADRRAAERLAADGTAQARNVTLETVELSASPTEAAASDGNRSPGDMLRMTRAVRRSARSSGIDVFFSPAVYTYFPLPLGLRSVVTLHDAIAERFPELTLPSKRARLFWRAKVRLALWQARLVLTVSEFSRRDLARELKIDPGIIRVTSEAPAPVYRPSSAAEVSAARRAHGLPEEAPYFIYVGGFNPHKHVDLLVRAHARIADEARERSLPLPRLVLVGTLSSDVFHGDQGRIRQTIAECATEPLVSWTGFVPDKELRHLHSGAAALVLPSECEGFGLPAVEAAACGTPVIATTESPLPELLSGAGRFIAPGQLAPLEAALRELAFDQQLRTSLGQTALERSAVMTWERAAQTTHAALAEAAR